MTFPKHGTLHTVGRLGKHWLALQLSGRFSAAVRIATIESVSVWSENDVAKGAKVCTAECVYLTEQTAAAVLDAILNAEGGAA